LKFNQKVSFSCASPTARKAMLYFTNLPTSYLVESDFNWVTELLSQGCNWLHVGADDFCLSLTTLQLDTQKCAQVSTGPRNTLNIMPIINPWITELKNFLHLWNWVHILPIFLKLFSQHFFFKVRLIDSVVVKTLLLFRFLIFHAIIEWNT